MRTYLRRLWLVVFLLGILLPANASVGEARSQTPRVLDNDWTLTGNMVATRQYHTLSVLPDGTALAVGGYYYESGEHYLNSSEIYTPLTNTWAATNGSMTTARRYHTATVLLDGRVLVAGGENGTGTTNSAEIFDPATGLWTPTGSLNQSRYRHTATRLQDGRVLVVGGCYTMTVTSCTIVTEIFDPASGTWEVGPNLPSGQGRMNHTATLLQDGSVLVAGGYAPKVSDFNLAKSYNNAYRYIPGGTTWSLVGTMSATAAPRGRSQHNAVLRRDGKVLFVGGYYFYDPLIGDTEEGYLSSSEVYDPVANTWTDLYKPLAAPRSGMAAVLDAEGSFILLGGDLNGATSDVEYLDINSGSDNWHYLFGELNVQRRFHAAAVLPGGVILVAGGRDQDGNVVNSAETNRFWLGSADLDDLRTANYGLYRPSATLMPNGDVLVTGGGYENTANQIICHNFVHRWVFADDTFTDVQPVENMRNARCNHSVTLLPDGRVVVLGGSGSISGSASGTGEIFNGTTWTYLYAASDFESHEAVLLPNGTVFIVQGGGQDSYIFDPSDLSFRKTLNQGTGVYTAFTVTLMENGKVLILGSQSNATVEVFDPENETFTAVPHPSPSTLFNTHEALLLPDGRVMVTGGRSGSGPPRRETYFFDPQTSTWSAGPPMTSGRRYHQMLVLPDGRPVVIGGQAVTGILDENATTKIEIYDRVDNSWHSAGDMLEARREHEALLTLTGKILIIGGMDEFGNPLFNVERFNFANISTTNALWQPTVTDVRCVDCDTSRQIEVTGSDFTEAWEGSSGLTNQSAANQPLVQIIRLDNGQMEWLRPGEASSDGRFLSAPIPGFPDGPVMVFTYVNGSFQGGMGMISGYHNKVYLPMLRR